MPTWIVLGLVAAVCAALVAIFGKLGLEQVGPVPATAARTLIMATVTSAAVIATGSVGELNSVDRRGWLFITLAALAGAASWLAYFAALRLGPVTGVGALDRLSMVFIVLLAALFLGESLTVMKVIGCGLVVAGAVMIAR
jgi:transporter family protein